MKQRYRLFRRSWGMFYWIDDTTGKQGSLRTKESAEAKRLLHAKNETEHLPSFNLKMARVYLQAADPKAVTRTWQYVMDAIVNSKTGETQRRWRVQSQSKAFDCLRHVLLVETQAEHFLQVLTSPKVSMNVYLRRIHNFALDMNWLGCPVIPKRQWPKIHYGEKRAITFEEHEKIIAREFNPERKAFYQLLWHLGASQSDLAHLHAEDIDWTDLTITFNRKKTGSLAQIHFGEQAAKILQELAKTGPLFPYLITVRPGDRATEFKQRCDLVGVSGVSLHCYRWTNFSLKTKAGAGRLDTLVCSRQFTALGMSKNRLAENGGTRLDVSDYHPVLASWKPLEQALRWACDVDDDFRTDANSMINALKGVVSAEVVQDLHKLRMSRNDVTHNAGVSLLSQMGMTESDYTQDCVRLAALLRNLSSADLQRANATLKSGESPEAAAWRRLTTRLQELTSIESPYESITSMSERAPSYVITCLHRLRMTLPQIRNGKGDRGRFLEEIDDVLFLLRYPSRLVADRDEEQAAQIVEQRCENNRLVDEVKGASQLFDAWFEKAGGSLNNFRESIGELANPGTPLNSSLRRIEQVRRSVASGSHHYESDLSELLELYKIVANHAGTTGRANKSAKIGANQKKKHRNHWKKRLVATAGTRTKRKQ